jgi:hypothetical protein
MEVAAIPPVVTDEEVRETYVFVSRYRDLFTSEIRFDLLKWHYKPWLPPVVDPSNEPTCSAELLLHLKRLHFRPDAIPCFNKTSCQGILSAFSRKYQKDIKCDICHARARATPHHVSFMKDAFEADYFDPDDNLGTFERTFAFASANGASGSFYSKSVAIIQSSLSGKTRTMMELSRRIPMIYICNREPNESSGYPLSTPDLFDWLSTVPDYISGDLDIYVHCQCAALLDVHGRYCLGVMQQCVQSPAEQWVEYLQKFNRIQKLENFVRYVISEARELAAQMFRNARDIKMSNFLWNFDTRLMVGRRYMCPTPPLFSQSLLTWIICIDEARRFAKHVPKGCTYDLLTHLKIAMEKLPAGGVLVCMDSDIDILRPIEHTECESISERCWKQVVLTDSLTWDLGKRCLRQWVPKYMEETFVLQRKCLYGRPMWVSLILSGGDDAVMDLAQVKLFEAHPGNLHSERDGNFSSGALLALFASRVHLQINSDFGCKNQMVSSHLAHCDLIDGKDTAIISYPPDPVFAQASSNVWRREAEILQKMLDCSKIVQSGQCARW